MPSPSGHQFRMTFWPSPQCSCRQRSRKIRLLRSLRLISSVIVESASNWREAVAACARKSIGLAAHGFWSPPETSFDPTTGQGDPFPIPRPPSPFDAALAARPAPDRPPAELDRLARLLSLSSASGLHAHTRLRAELRPIAADRLRWALAVDLDGDPAAARAALGETGWALLARDQRDLPEREAPGLSPAALAELIGNLERIGGQDG